jgi:hypothetical protein
MPKWRRRGQLYLYMKKINCSETLVPRYQTRRRQNPSNICYRAVSEKAVPSAGYFKSCSGDTQNYCPTVLCSGLRPCSLKRHITCKCVYQWLLEGTTCRTEDGSELASSRQNLTLRSLQPVISETLQRNTGYYTVT